jgi:hypothetical protein
MVAFGQAGLSLFRMQTHFQLISNCAGGQVNTPVIARPYPPHSRARPIRRAYGKSANRSAICHQTPAIAASPNIEPVCAQFEPSLRKTYADIENWRPETVAQNSSVVAENRENYASETPRRLANSREYRTYICRSDLAHRDRTGWLGREDSNLRMAESKSTCFT